MGGTPIGAPIVGWVAELFGPRWGDARRRADLPARHPAAGRLAVARRRRRSTLAEVLRRRWVAAGGAECAAVRGLRPGRPAAGRLPRPDATPTCARTGAAWSSPRASTWWQRLARSPYRMRAVVGVPASWIERCAPVLAGLDVPRSTWWTSGCCPTWSASGSPAGVLASADRPAAGRPPSELLAAARRFAVLEAINDFENLGALFRNCRRVRRRRGAARPALRRSAVPAQRAGVDGPRVRRAVRGARPAVAGRRWRCCERPACGCSRSPRAGRPTPLRAIAAAAALGAVARRRGPGADRGGAGRRPTAGCGSRWPTGSTRSTSPPPARWRWLAACWHLDPGSTLRVPYPGRGRLELRRSP